MQFELLADLADGGEDLLADSLRLRIWSSWVMAPSPSQKKIAPGRSVSRTWRTLGITLSGVPVMIV